MTILDTFTRDGDCVTWLDDGLTEGETWEGNDWQGSVGAWAAGDERSGQGVGLVEVQGNIVWSSGRVGQGSRGLDPGRVSSLGGQDGTSGGEVGPAGDVGSSSEVGRDTDTFEELGGGNEGGDVGDTEVVLASSDGLVTEGRLEELNVGDFITTNFEESLSDRWLETGVGKVLGRELLQGVVVEDGLEVLEGQGVLQRWKRGGRLSQLCVHDDAKGS